MFAVLLLLLLNIFYAIIPQSYSLMCYMCDSIGEVNCFGSTCTGTACIKRSAIIDGFLRVQKMCQQTSEPLLEYCEKSVLWKGGNGVECICQTDYCNNAGKLFQNKVFTFLLLLIASLIGEIQDF